jgi:hypothetical protein
MKIRMYQHVKFGMHATKIGRAVEATAFGVCVIAGFHGFWWGRV